MKFRFISFLTFFILGFSSIIPVFDDRDFFVRAEDTIFSDSEFGFSGGNVSNETLSLPEPALEGFLLDAYNTSWINVSVNQSHFLFSNSYINQSLEHIDVFVPEELQDDFGYVTPCDPNLMVCQRGNAPDPVYGETDLFHILNDWTNEYSDRFYIETDYIFNYAMYDSDSDIPSGFNWLRINQNITVNYTENNSGIGDLLNTIVDIDDSHSIRINVSSSEHNLVLNYTYYYNDEITAYFEDVYCSYTPPIKDTVTIKSNDETFDSLNATINKNNSMVQLVKWHGESVMNISLDNGLPTGWIIENTTFTQQYNDSNVHFYPVNITDDGGLEFLLELNNNPESNIVSFNVDAPDLDFYYQPALHSDHPTWINENNPDDTNKSNATSFRPEDVVGSYAVYHNSKSNNEYKTGKVFHIYRPMIIDSENNSVWGNLTVENGMMNISIPQSFLDSAVYPIRVDPTFGYKSDGDTKVTATDDGSIIFDDASGAAGTGNFIGFYGDFEKSDQNLQCYLYDSDKNKVTNGVTDESIESTGERWVTQDFSTSPTLTEQTYYIGVWSDGSGPPFGNYMWAMADSVGGQDFYRDDGNSYSSWPSTLGIDYTASDYRLSVYVNYTASGAANNAPTLSGENPSNQSTDISLQPTCNITVSDADSDTMSVTFASNYSDGSTWVNYQTNTTVSTGSSVSWSFTGANSYDTTYWWRVYADDSTDNTSETYYFTTESESLSWNLNNTFSFSGGNTSSWNLLESFSFSGGNSSSWNLLDTFSFTGGNSSSWNLLDSFSFSGGNSSSWILDDSFSFSGGNTSSWYLDSTFSFTGGNTSSWHLLDTFSFTGGNSSSWNLLDTFSFSGGNTSSWSLLETFGFTGGNISSWHYLDSFGFSGGNSSSWTLDNTFSFSGGNTSTWNLLDTFSFSGGNTSSWHHDSTFSFTGGNSSSWNLLDTFSFSGGSSLSWNLNDTFSFTGGNISSWNQIESFSFSGGNSSSWYLDSTFSFSGGNSSSWYHDSTFSFSGGNSSSWNLLDSFGFSGGNVSGYTWTLDDSFSFSGGNRSTWILNDTFSFTGGNTSSWYLNDTFSFSGGNSSSWNLLDTFSFTGGNTPSWNLNDTFSFTGGNTSNWFLNDTFSFTGGNTSSWHLLDTFSFSGGSSLSWTLDNSFTFTAGNITDWTLDNSFSFTAGNISAVWNHNHTFSFTGGNSTYIEGGFTLTVSKNTFTADPWQSNATEYRWILRNGDTAQTDWENTSYMDDYVYVPSKKGDYSLELLLRNEFNQTKNITKAFTIGVPHPDNIQPLETTDEPEEIILGYMNNIYNQIALLAFAVTALILYLLHRKYPKKISIYFNKKPKKKKKKSERR